jgi:hypothetical protein
LNGGSYPQGAESPVGNPQGGKSVARFSVATAMDAFHLAIPAGSFAKLAFETCVGRPCGKCDGEDSECDLFHDVFSVVVGLVFPGVPGGERANRPRSVLPNEPLEQHSIRETG